MLAQKWNKAWLSACVSLVCAILVDAATAAEIQPWDAGLGIGLVKPGSKRNLDNGAAGLLTLGYRLDERWGGELFGIVSSNNGKTGFADSDISMLGLRGLYHFYDESSAWTPYLDFGAGRTRLKPGTSETSALVGAGVKRVLRDHLFLRGEINAHRGFDSKATDVSAFVGVGWQWGGNKAQPAPTPMPVAAAAPADSDGDGVPDAQDQCPNTPKGTQVDVRGCPIDGDSDGDDVADSLDKCPNTPKGVKVDASGCPIDSDGDGVPDYLDKCPNTPKGVKVDAAGCPIDIDSDGDGVADSRDKCPGTPKGAKVNAMGCLLDSDGDGVPDFLDKCPNTPAGSKVDANGCTLKLSEKVSISLKLNFDSGKSAFKAEFSAEILRVADFMLQYPSTSVVIEGHTDNVGDTSSNQKLSQRRAESVAQSLVHDHGIAAARVKAMGYGQSRPIADNKTAEARAANRRVTAVIEEVIAREVR